MGADLANFLLEFIIRLSRGMEGRGPKTGGGESQETNGTQTLGWVELRQTEQPRTCRGSSEWRVRKGDRNSSRPRRLGEGGLESEAEEIEATLCRAG